LLLLKRGLLLEEDSFLAANKATPEGELLFLLRREGLRVENENVPRPQRQKESTNMIENLKNQIGDWR